ncbi:MAG: glycerophosphodiester phosphodiesterase [Clostridia bacterium]|nr:glycerophosphodiester phosphodiesterase [Clostridia bacterium]
MLALVIVCIVLALAIILFCTYLLLMVPGKRRKGFPFEGAMIAHRGLHGDGVPENSLAAFRAAAQNGGLGAELDVQMTKDGKLIVFHDADLKRVCGAEKSVTGTDFEELQTFTLLDTNERVPLFSDVLEALDGIPLVCEVKVSPGADIPALCRATLEALKTYKGPYCVESFHPAALRWFKKHAPDVIRGQLSCDMFRAPEKLPFFVRFLLTNLLLNFYTRPDFIAYDFRHAGTLGFRLCAALYRPYLAAWTPRGEEEIEAARAAGFDTLIFEKNKR